MCSICRNCIYWMEDCTDDEDWLGRPITDCNDYEEYIPEEVDEWDELFDEITDEF